MSHSTAHAIATILIVVFIFAVGILPLLMGIWADIMDIFRRLR